MIEGCDEVEVGIGRADELDESRGLSSELGECGVMWRTNPIRAGFGMPLITAQGRCCPMWTVHVSAQLAQPAQQGRLGNVAGRLEQMVGQLNPGKLNLVRLS